MRGNTTETENRGCVERVCDVAARTFGVKRESLGATSGVGAVSGWDSLGHLRLMMAIEAEFGVRFETQEIGGPRTIDELEGG